MIIYINKVGQDINEDIPLRVNLGLVTSVQDVLMKNSNKSN